MQNMSTGWAREGAYSILIASWTIALLCHPPASDSFVVALAKFSDSEVDSLELE